MSAYVWLNAAATAGDESAQALRDRVTARMTRGQIADAEAQARDRGW